MSARRGAAVAFELPSDASLHNTVKRLDLFVGELLLNVFFFLQAIVLIITHRPGVVSK